MGYMLARILIHLQLIAGQVKGRLHISAVAESPVKRCGKAPRGIVSHLVGRTNNPIDVPGNRSGLGFGETRIQYDPPDVVVKHCEETFKGMRRHNRRLACRIQQHNLVAGCPMAAEMHDMRLVAEKQFLDVRGANGPMGVEPEAISVLGGAQGSIDGPTFLVKLQRMSLYVGRQEQDLDHASLPRFTYQQAPPAALPRPAGHSAIHAAAGEEAQPSHAHPGG